MANISQLPRNNELKQSGAQSSLLDAEFSRLMRPPGASQIHVESFNKDKSVLALQNAEVKAIAKGLAQLLGHNS